MAALPGFSDEQLQAALSEHGSNVAAARALGCSDSTFGTALHQRGLAGKPRRNGRRRTVLTRESLHQALLPPNNCRVRQFLDSLDGQEREVVEEALGYNKEDFPAGHLRDWLVREGFPPDEVPGNDALNDHRAGRRPCRCQG